MLFNEAVGVVNGQATAHQHDGDAWISAHPNQPYPLPVLNEAGQLAELSIFKGIRQVLDASGDSYSPSALWAFVQSKRAFWESDKAVYCAAEFVTWYGKRTQFLATGELVGAAIITPIGVISPRNSNRSGAQQQSPMTQ